MNISTNSWHYRLHKFRSTETYHELRNHYNRPREYPSVSLCWYFWATVGTIFTTLVLGLMSLLIGGFILGWFFNGLAIFVLALFSVFLDFLDYGYSFIMWLIIMGCFTTIITFFSVLATLKGEMKFAPDYLTKWFPKKETSDSIVIPKQLGLVGEYIKAKKSKWCPLVEVVDE